MTAQQQTRLPSSLEWLHRQAEARGREAAAAGKHVSTNPYNRYSELNLHLAWSEGHRMQEPISSTKEPDLFS